jgi:solute carrier family 25 phosphate transporter 3
LLISITGINLGARLVAGLAAAVVSQPADMMLSRINKERAVIGESISCRLVYIASELRLRSAYTGMQVYIVIISGIIAVQFGIYGDIKKVHLNYDLLFCCDYWLRLLLILPCFRSLGQPME